MIRKLEKQEYTTTSELSLEVYMYSGQADFNNDGLEAFKSSIFDDQYIDKLTIYGAFEKEELIGILGIKEENNHISLFFLKPEHLRKGIGKKLFNYMMSNNPASEITVNSSSYAVPFYKSLGFKATGGKQCVNGLTFFPMKK
ncbi:GNAT family N-acetyltransferase [Parabacteroides sp.]